MPPRFSIVIPLYNKGNEIGRALDSVISQTVADFEVLVIDDGSTDDGPELVRSFPDHRIKLISQPNAGVSAARNRGIEEASADLIAFLDADDAWEPKFLEAITSLTACYPQAGAYATAYLIKEPGGKMRSPSYRGIPKSRRDVILPSYFRSATLGDMPVCASAVCIPKAVFEEAGMFPRGERLGEDHDMWARIALHHPIAFSWAAGAVYFQDSCNRACVRAVPGEDLIFIRNLQQMLDHGQVPTPIVDEVQRFLSRQLIHVAAINLKAGNKEVAKRVLADGRSRSFAAARLWWMLWSVVPHGVLSAAWGGKRCLKELFRCMMRTLPA